MVTVYAQENAGSRFINTDSMINCIKIGNTMCSLYWIHFYQRWNEGHSQPLIQVTLKQQAIMLRVFLMLQWFLISHTMHAIPIMKKIYKYINSYT